MLAKVLMRTVEMNGYRLVVYKELKLRDGVLVQGLPGIGLVGKIAVDYIISSLNLPKVAELTGPGLMLPVGNAGVFVDGDGRLLLPSYKFYLLPLEGKDVLFLTSEVQPVSWAQFEVAERVLDFFTSIGGREVVGVCGTSTESEEVEVYFAAAPEVDTSKLEGLNLKRSSGGTITGACGLLPALASLRGLRGYVIMGSTHTSEPNPVAARAVVVTLSRLLGFSISLDELDRMILEIKSREEVMRKMLEQAEKRAETGLPSWYV
ncbi:MAG: PAC2 family protein [Thermofilum sp.]|nr:PAC2 family protein [Thermofilum sp.]